LSVDGGGRGVQTKERKGGEEGGGGKVGSGEEDKKYPLC